ncbi:DNA/RNA non-specific endonuclease [Streptomyces sp. NPDC002867]
MPGPGAPTQRGSLWACRGRKQRWCTRCAERSARRGRSRVLYTNIIPQMDDFNQSSKGGLWGQLEDAVFADVEVDDLKVSAFGGPVFQEDDRFFRDVQIPANTGKSSHSPKTVNSRPQNLNQLEALELDEFRVFQVNLSEIEERGHLRFPATLRKADTLVVLESLAE